MSLEQMTGRYLRLKQELAIAYRAQPWQAARIDRLANELAVTEREIAALKPANDDLDRVGFSAYADHAQAMKG